MLAEIHNLEQKIADIERDKATRLSKGKFQDAAKESIVEKESEFWAKIFSRLNITQMATLLKWHGMEKEKSNNGKEYQMLKWWRIWEETLQLPAFEIWMQEDELKLMELMKMKIDMLETTTAGQLEQRKKREVVLAVKNEL